MKISRIFFISFYLIFITFYPKILISNDNTEEISPRDIERFCEVYRYSDNYGDIECSKSRLKVIERKCEAYIYSFPYGDVECQVINIRNVEMSNLRKVEKKCEVYMYSYKYGEISCYY